MIESLAHVSLVVADTQKSLAFYHDVLGLTVSEARPELGFPGAWLVLGAVEIHLLEVPNADPTDGRPAHGGRDRHTAFFVIDLADLAARLVAAGVPVSHSRSGRAALFCRDPDGNALEFIQLPDDSVPNT